HPALCSAPSFPTRRSSDLMRLGVLETPLFSRLLEERRIERVPVVMLFERHWKEVILSALVALATQAPVYLFTSFALAYGTTRLRSEEHTSELQSRGHLVCR